MKALDMAFKDLLCSFRSAFAVVMMFGAPLLMTGLFYLAFGRASTESGVSLPKTRVQVVNLDQAVPQSGVALGQMIVEILRTEDISHYVEVHGARDEASARAAVDRQEAGVAVIIPANLSAAATSDEGRATITLYADPTLTLGPGVVKTLIGSLVDGFAGPRIALQVAADQFQSRGQTLDANTATTVMLRYAEWARAQGERLRSGQASGVRLTPPPARGSAQNQRQPIAALIMSGMMIFFVFFTGAGAAESILREDEEGTLARLFTTPTPRGVILAGKLIGIYAILIVQVGVLLVASRLMFGIVWGQPLSVALMTVALAMAAAGFGILVMSFVKNTRQSGPVMGGVLTITAMLGGLFTVGIQNLPALYATVNLLTPHGWAMRGWRLALAGAGVAEIGLPSGVLAAMGALCFGIGLFFFRKRFATGG